MQLCSIHENETFSDKEDSADCPFCTAMYAKCEEIEKVDARGKVRMYSKGSIAKNEQSVYHFKDSKIASTAPPKAEKNRSGIAGKANPNKSTGGKAVAGESRKRQEKK